MRLTSRGFPKEHRLRKRSEFRLVYDSGTPYRNTGFHLFVLPREGGGPSRLGLTVTRDKGGSVVRNRLRRWARETFRLWGPQVRPGRDLVLNFHRGLSSSDRAFFDRQLHHVFQRARLFELG